MRLVGAIICALAMSSDLVTAKGRKGKKGGRAKMARKPGPSSKNYQRAKSSSSKKDDGKPKEPQICLKSVGFDGGQVYDKRHILPGVCPEHSSRTCCDQRHVRWIAAKLLAMQRAGFSDGCIAASKQAFCGICDSDFGTGRSAAITGQSVVLCPNLCGEWYNMCRDEYFSGGLLAGLNPCTENALVCSKLRDIDLNEVEESKRGIAAACTSAFGSQYVIDEVLPFDQIVTQEVNAQQDSRRNTRKKASKVAKGNATSDSAEDESVKEPPEVRLARPCPVCYNGVPSATRYGKAQRPPDVFRPTKWQLMWEKFQQDFWKYVEEFGAATVLLIFLTGSKKKLLGFVFNYFAPFSFSRREGLLPCVMGFASVKIMRLSLSRFPATAGVFSSVDVGISLYSSVESFYFSQAPAQWSSADWVGPQ